MMNALECYYCDIFPLMNLATEKVLNFIEAAGKRKAEVNGRESIEYVKSRIKSPDSMRNKLKKKSCKEKQLTLSHRMGLDNHYDPFVLDIMMPGMDGLTVLEYISDSNGDVQSHSSSFNPGANSSWDMQMTKETPFEMRFFVVYCGKGNSVTAVNLERIASASKDEAGAMADKVISKAKSAGYYGYYRYQVTETAQGKMVVFLDCYSSIQTQNMLLLISALIGMVSLLLLVIAIVVSLFKGHCADCC